MFFSGVAWFQWKSEDAVIELNCRNATVNGNVLHITQVISHLSPHRRTQAASYTWLHVPSVCEFVATTAEKTDMPFGGGRGRGISWPNEPRKPIRWGCTLAPPGENSGSICATAAMRAVATVTQQLVYFSCSYTAMTTSILKFVSSLCSDLS